MVLGTQGSVKVNILLRAVSLHKRLMIKTEDILVINLNPIISSRRKHFDKFVEILKNFLKKKSMIFLYLRSSR